MKPISTSKTQIEISAYLQEADLVAKKVRADLGWHKLEDLRKHDKFCTRVYRAEQLNETWVKGERGRLIHSIFRLQLEQGAESNHKCDNIRL